MFPIKHRMIRRLPVYRDDEDEDDTCSTSTSGYNSPNFHFPVPKNRQHYYNLADQKKVMPNSKSYSCDTCNKSFFSHKSYNSHIEEHVECPFPECGLKAHINVIDRHITNQHMLVNFSALQMDDEAWKAERRKRFPTVERAELRREELKERLERGERVGLDKNKKGKFGSKSSKIKTNSQNDKNVGTKKEDKDVALNSKKRSLDGESTGPPKKKVSFRERKREKFKKENVTSDFTVPYVEVDLYESDEENRYGLPAFKGTRKFYEELGEISYFSNKNEVSCDQNDDFVISDDDDEWEPSTETKSSEQTIQPLNNALGSLMGAYSDSDDSGPEVQSLSLNSKKHSVSNVTNDSANTSNNNNEVNSNETSGVDENKGTGKRKRRARHRNNNTSTNEGNKVKKVVPPRPIKRRKRVTLLERLLEPDIRHERNVLLQCIRYITKNNFFD